MQGKPTSPALTIYVAISNFNNYAYQKMKEDFRMNFRLGLILAGLGTFFVTTSVEAQKPVDNGFTALASANLETARTAELPVDAEVAYQKALDLALDGIEAAPLNSLSHFQAARAYMGLGRYVEADSSYSRAETLWPDYLEDILIRRENGWVEA